MTQQVAPAAGSELLRVENLDVTYVDNAEDVRAVIDVSFSVRAGEIVGVVGESGSGKSSLASAILRLLPRNARVRGSIWLSGEDLTKLPERQMRRVRGRRLGMIFQDPATALNPVFTIRTQIVDTLLQHRRNVGRRQANSLAAELVEGMGIPSARLDSYPHQLSGGMRQRALIAAAMAAGPSILVADEPTSDLDTISQAQILGLLRELRDDRGVGLVLISHDLSVIAAACDRVIVMYGGYLVEGGDTAAILTNPLHPYTRSLLTVSRKDRDSGGRFISAQRFGEPTATGCPYVNHCPVRLPECDAALPTLRPHADRIVRCYLYPDLPLVKHEN